MCTTNPTLARGLTLAMISAAGLADTLARPERDPAAQAQAMDDLVTARIEPFYTEQAAIDEVRLRRMRRVVFPGTGPGPDPGPGPGDPIGYWQVRAAAPFDPVVFRAFWKVMGMMAVPGEAYADPEVVARTREVLGRPGAAPATVQPSRAQVLAALR